MEAEATGVILSTRERQKAPSYRQRAGNVLQTIFHRHFEAFCAHYDERFAKEYGAYRIERIARVGNRFRTCGDYRRGIARIRCTKPGCGHEIFRPFSCKGFYLCPSCSHKRTLLLAERLHEDVLLQLPHRQFVFTLPKALRVHFRYHADLFASVSRLIFELIRGTYEQAAGKPVRTAAVISFQSFGSGLRVNPHFHAIVLEGGFEGTGPGKRVPSGRFVFLPIGDTTELTERFRQEVIRLYLAEGLITPELARRLRSWEHSGFSVDNSVKIRAGDARARENLSQYIARGPIAPGNLIYEPTKGRVIVKTRYNAFLKQNVSVLDGEEFIARLTQFLPPTRARYVRFYGLYSSRSRAKWTEWETVARSAPQGWLDRHGQNNAPAKDATVTTEGMTSKNSSWARLIAKVYEVDPMICPQCGSPMCIVAIIQDRDEVIKILRHLVRRGRPPPGLDPATLN